MVAVIEGSRDVETLPALTVHALRHTTTPAIC